MGTSYLPILTYHEPTPEIAGLTSFEGGRLGGDRLTSPEYLFHLQFLLDFISLASQVKMETWNFEKMLIFFETEKMPRHLDDFLWGILE